MQNSVLIMNGEELAKFEEITNKYVCFAHFTKVIKKEITLLSETLFSIIGYKVVSLINYKINICSVLNSLQL